MKTRFDIYVMDEALIFVSRLDKKTRVKVSFVLQKARCVEDPQLFKKITTHIWEFRIRYYKPQIRLFAFWSPFEKSIIVCTHGICNKNQKTPKREIEKADQIRLDFIDRQRYEKG